MRLRQAAFLSLLAAFLAAPGVSHAEPGGYAEIMTSQGKVVRGLSRDEAVRRFGYPRAVGDETWLYEANGQRTYVFLPSTFRVQLYPKKLDANVDNVIELKLFAGNQDEASSDVTSQAEFIFSDKDAFKLTAPNIFIARKAGEYTVMARYKGVFSNACKITVKPRQGEEQGDKLLKIEILPYAPVIYEGESIPFTAMGVYSEKRGTYAVRDISDQVKWTVAGDGKQSEVDARRFSFPTRGKAIVGCSLKDIEAYPQTVTVEQLSLERRSESIRHLTVMPEFMTIRLEQKFSLTVMATYENNAVREISEFCRYQLNDRSVKLERPGKFQAEHLGACDIFAEANGVRSGTVKVMVANDKDSISLPPVPKEEKKPTVRQARKDIENEMKKLSQILAVADKKVLSIRISPLSAAFDKGENAKFTATAFNSDGSQSDVSFTSVWRSADPSVATIDKGSLKAVAPGETDITATYQNVQATAHVTVRNPRLVSIALSPESVRASRFDRPRLKAEGVLSDGTRSDITGDVNWRIDGHSVMVHKGTLRPIGFGTSSVFARQAAVESLPAKVKVVVTPLWCLLVAAEVSVSLLLATGAALFGFYLSVKRKASAIVALKGDHPRYISALYGNLREVLSIFGLSAHPSECPLVIARRADEKFGFGSSCAELTARFEEAKFSDHHIFAEQAAECERLYGVMVAKALGGVKGSRKARILVTSLVRKIPLQL